MTLFRFIPAGDIDLVNGKVQLIIGKLQVRQKIATRLKFFLGEWFLDQRQGVPYYRNVLVMNPDLDVIRTLYRKVILSVPEVTRVDNLNITFNQGDRTLTVSFDAVLGNGEILTIRPADTDFIVDLSVTT